MDPGGTEIFPEVITAISDHLPIENIEVIFGSHQDPDILSSLALWLGVCPQAKIYVPWVWTGFITHFGCDKSQLTGVPDDGGSVELSGGYKVDFIPAHYLHSSGNLNLYDPTAKILFSGDIGAALLPEDANQIFVEDFEKHTKYMEMFHRRWMPSNRARDVWVERVRKLDIDMMCPQHGGIFRRDDVQKFLEWFSGLELGSAAI
jgi:flavorubredoxin